MRVVEDLPGGFGHPFTCRPATSGQGSAGQHRQRVGAWVMPRLKSNFQGKQAAGSSRVNRVVSRRQTH